MISRVAEACFWLHRYIERLENTARLLQVNRMFVLDVSLAPRDRWLPLLVVSGEEERFTTRYSAEAALDGELVQEYLTWNEHNPVSIFSSLRWARENARSIREVISLELWQSINELWHWMRGPEGRFLYQSDPDAFYSHIKSFGTSFVGLAETTMLREQPFDFMSLGMLLERSAQTARILDVKYHSVSDSDDEGTERALDAARCVALLRSCSASEPFAKRVRQTPRGKAVAAFLVLEEAFPRSVLYGLKGSVELVDRIASDAEVSVAVQARKLLGELVTSLQEQNASSLVKRGVHEELTRIINSIAQICDALGAELFNPTIEAITKGSTGPGDGVQCNAN